MEITAAYREPRIKTYGFQKKTDLLLFELSGNLEDPTSLGRDLCGLGELGIDFHLTFGHASQRPASRIYLLIAREHEGLAANHFRAFAGSHGRLSGRAVCPVELVFFQGPHFGDRFGILDTTLQTLSSKGLRTIAAACSLSCVYLVVPEGTSEGAVSALSEVFEVPRPSRALTKKPFVDSGGD